MSLKTFLLFAFAMVLAFTTATASWYVPEVAAAAVEAQNDDKPSDERPQLEPLQLIQPITNLQLQLRIDAGVPLLLPDTYELRPLAAQNEYPVAIGPLKLHEHLVTCVQPAQAP
jgi:hypothetical protein